VLGAALANGVCPKGGGADGGGIFFSLAVAGQHASTINLAHSTHPNGLILLSCRRSLVFADDPSAAEPPHSAPPPPLHDHVAHDGTIPSCARRLWRCSGEADPAGALLCGSAHPARLLGLASKGSLAPGADADLLLLDPESLAVRACFVGGRLTWSDSELHGALWFHH
jgi:hypothetical protein